MRAQCPPLHASNHSTPRKDLSRTSGQRAVAVCAVQFVLALAGALWILGGVLSASEHKGTSLLKMTDCRRIDSFRPATCLLFMGLFLGQVLLSPTKHVVSSAKHRAFFQKIGLFLACAYAVAAAVVGYPQGLCDHSCSCGICAELETKPGRSASESPQACSRESQVTSHNCLLERFVRRKRYRSGALVRIHEH